MHCLQKDKLFYQKIQGDSRKKIRTVKILQTLQKTHTPQGRFQKGMKTEQGTRVLITNKYRFKYLFLFDFDLT